MKRLLLPIVPLLFFLFAPMAHAAVAYDTSIIYDGTTGTSFSSASTGVLTNGIAVVVVNDGANSGSCGSITATWYGVAMTQFSCGGNITKCCLASPPSGVKTIVLAHAVKAVAMTYSGASQSCPTDGGNNSGSSNATMTGTMTTTDDNSMMVMWGVTPTGVNLTAGSGTTARGVQTARTRLVDSGTPVTPAGSKTLTINADGTMTSWDTGFFAISPPSATADNPILGLVRALWIN